MEDENEDFWDVVGSNVVDKRMLLAECLKSCSDNVVRFVSDDSREVLVEELCKNIKVISVSSVGNEVNVSCNTCGFMCSALLMVEGNYAYDATETSELDEFFEIVGSQRAFRSDEQGDGRDWVQDGEREREL